LGGQRGWLAQQCAQTGVAAVEEWGDLVVGEVEEADRHRPPGRFGEDRAQCPSVVGFRGPPVGAQEWQLGAQQPDSGGAAGAPDARLDVGRDVA
jgi:hypothetical protein